MPQRLLILVILYVAFFYPAKAQQIDSVLSVYAEKFTPEKLHLHLDRDIYSNDETIYYKAYLLEDHDLSTVSKNLYVDFYDAAGKLLQHTTAPVFQSSAKGAFTIPQNYTGNVLHVKAYTKWMLNFDTSFIYSRTVRIHQSIEETTGKKKNTEPVANTTVVKLYPEGGFAIEGLSNRFAFAAVNQLGEPVSIKGIIKSTTGKIIDSPISVHDGMGLFSLLPEKNQAYSFEWKDDKGNTGSTPVLIEKKSGANIKVEAHTQKASFTVQRTTNAGDKFNTMHLLVHRGNTLRYKFDINLSEKTKINFDIATNDLQTGVVQFTLFNDDWIPVAERIIFVNNQNHFFQPQLNVVKADLTKKGKSDIEIYVPDTLLANMSVAVIDAGMSDINDPTIFSDFLLTDELKGKINNPGYYFQTLSIDSLQVAKNLDLVMLTHGHRRFDWEKIAKGEFPVIHYPAETDYLGIQGKLTNKKLVRSKDVLVNVMLQAKDSTKTVLIIPVEKGGVFEKKNVFIYDTVKLFYSVNSKKAFYGEEIIQFDNNLLTTSEKNKFFTDQLFAKNESNHSINAPDTIVNKPTSYFFDEQERIRKLTAFKTLKEVVVSSRVKTKMQILDNFYTRGVFAGEGNNYRVDVEGDIHATEYINIFYYLQSKIPGLQVNPGTLPSEPVISWFKTFDVAGEPTVFLDEVQVEINSISSVPVSQIAYVKAFRPPFVGSFLNGGNGTIVIYTKKGFSPVYKDTSGIKLAQGILVGYTKFKEFTQPDYENSKTGNETDYRATLYWNPYVLTDKSNQRTTISFFNNDISKKLLVILEGINLEGKMARVVKLLE